MDLEVAYDKFITYTFKQGTDHIRTGKLIEYLANQFYLGVNSYQWYLANATNVIINYKNYVNNPKHPRNKKTTDKKLAFIQKDYTNAKCYSCINMGYISLNYTDNIKEESGNAQATIEQSTS